MRSFSPTLLGAFAVLALAAGCSPDAAPRRLPSARGERSDPDSFDRLTLSRGESSTFRASLIGSGARLSSSGLTFAARATSVAGVTAANGRARVQGLAVGRTWVVVRSAAAADSVEVVVE